MAQTTEHPYIVTDDQILGGEPIVKNTRTPVRAIVEIWRLGTHPEDIPNHLPHLSLGQVFDALSYYSDHQEEIQKYIEENRVPHKLIDPFFEQNKTHWGIIIAVRRSSYEMVQRLLNILNRVTADEMKNQIRYL